MCEKSTGEFLAGTPNNYQASADRISISLSGGDVGGSHTLPYMQDWVGEEVVILEILAVTITIVRL